MGASESSRESYHPVLDLVCQPSRGTPPCSCHACGEFLHNLRRRCWDCRQDLCPSPCASEGNAHKGHVISADPVDQLVSPGGACLGETLLHGLITFGHRPFLALLPPDANLPKGPVKQRDFPTVSSPFQWISYRTVLRRVINISLSLAAYKQGDDEGLVGLCGDNSYDWIVADLACIIGGLVPIALHPCDSLPDTQECIAHAQIKVIICARSQVTKLLTIGGLAGSSLRTLVVMGECSDLKSSDIEIYSLAVLELKGEEMLRAKFTCNSANTLNKSQRAAEFLTTVVASRPPDSLLTLVYTSGSTGTAKAVMVADRSWNTTVVGCRHTLAARNVPAEVAFRSLGHASGSKQLFSILVQGGQLCVYPFPGERMTGPQPDVWQRLFDIYQIFRPTAVADSPHLWNAVYRVYLSRQAALFGSMASTAVVDIGSSTQASLSKFGKGHSTIMEGFFGDRLKSVQTGSAPTSADVVAMMRECFPNASEGYGCTETGNITVNNVKGEAKQLQLSDVPEMGYLRTDLPYPRGEVMVRTDLMALGYYRAPEATAAQFSDGWFRTGDIAELRDGNQFVLIDRKKDIFKLAQGIHVSPLRVERCLLDALPDLLSDLFVTGLSTASFCVALVVPKENPNREHKNSGSSETHWWLSLTTPEQNAYKELVLRKMHEVGIQVLQDNEIPKRVSVVTTPFSETCKLELGAELLSSQGKRKRFLLRKLFDPTIQNLSK